MTDSVLSTKPRNLMTVMATGLALALLAPVPVARAEGASTLAATMDVYVFPKLGQAATQQSIDEAACYEWAVEQTGSDPFELSRRAADATLQAAQAKEQSQQAAKGSGAKGLFGGAAAGALIGELTNLDTGRGAAYGAAAGLLGSKLHSRNKQSQVAQSADAHAAQQQRASAEQRKDFNKAFSVCLEAKDYLVKY